MCSGCSCQIPAFQYCWSPNVHYSCGSVSTKLKSNELWLKDFPNPQLLQPIQNHKARFLNNGMLLERAGVEDMDMDTWVRICNFCKRDLRAGNIPTVCGTGSFDTSRKSVDREMFSSSICLIFILVFVWLGGVWFRNICGMIDVWWDVQPEVFFFVPC